MGQRLKALRLAARMTQRELAERSGIPLGTLVNWEQDRNEPALSAAVPLARALGISLDVLAGYDPPRRRNYR
jgi:transcriptional regulator with XRE-family HTH domain